MYKVVGLAKRHPEMTFDQFVEHYRTVHGKLGETVMRAVGAARYARRFIKPFDHPLHGQPAVSMFDVIIEFWFHDEAAMRRAMSYLDGEVREEFERDESILFDRAASQMMMVVDEDESALWSALPA